MLQDGFFASLRMTVLGVLRQELNVPSHQHQFYCSPSESVIWKQPLATKVAKNSGALPQDDLSRGSAPNIF
jgi:hypothetical protein